MSQEEFAAAIGVTVAAVYRWEGKGKRGKPAPRSVKLVNPSLDTLERITSALGITMERFYGRVPKRRRVA